ncbi:hypothetical protein [Kitasatospora sp. DSM 101779]|uniref:hypothetical protein n=1 Tax=Kitasatospora sp. DSM 101779 TaxID=2853165 RepID=UPI0021DACB8E|nr:hypothetical protein [Kitasatospora sp. DSM 101779]MCU7826508.1 hypothetical protein [Kitasatospora sp. DSM 101779]
MSADITFFLVPDDDRARAVRCCGPKGGLPAVAGHWFSAADAVETWETYFVPPPPPTRRFLRRPRPQPDLWDRLRWIVPISHDASGTFAVPDPVTHALAAATPEELDDLAEQWTEQLRREDGDEMTDDDLAALLRAVAQLATTALDTGGTLYCCFC